MPQDCSFGPDMAFVTRHYPKDETVINKILELGTTIAVSRVVAVMRDSGAWVFGTCRPVVCGHGRSRSLVFRGLFELGLAKVEV